MVADANEEKFISGNLGKLMLSMSIPTIVLFKNGKEIKRNTGFIDENSLISFLENI